MPYAHRSGICDADTHMMERPDWLAEFADAAIRPKLFDGGLERFPGLRIAVVEMGAAWIISFIKHIDQSFRAFRRLQDLSDLSLKPSEYILRQVKVTPFAGEDVGWILASGGEDLLMFASDYPHHKGTDDPMNRFERTLERTPDTVKQKFYTDNFADFVPAR